MALQFTNDARATLATGITDVDVSLTVSSGDGASFPLVTSPDTFYITLENIVTGVFEVCLVTSHEGGTPDTFTITRGQDNTTAVAWVAGDLVELRVCAAVLDSFEGHDHDATYAALVHNHDSTYINTAGDSMTGSLDTVTPTASTDNNTAVNAAWADANYGFYELGTGIPNTVIPSEDQLLFIAARSITLPAGLTDSVGYATTAPTSAVSFDVKKNGVSAGSIDWLATANTATFTMSTATTLAAGDRVTITSPANCYSIAGVTITLLGSINF